MSNGKGDSPRNIFTESYRENYDHIFRKKPLDGKQNTSNNTEQKDKTYDKNQTNSRGIRGATR